MESRRNFLGIHADWQAIGLCLLAATTFWLFNAMNDDHTADISYPVTFIYNDKKMIPTAALPTKVRFNASGFGWNLLRKTMRVKRPAIIINLDDLNSYKFLTAKDIMPIIKSQMDDIKINYIIQDTIHFEFDKLKKMHFPLSVNQENVSLGPGYKITGPINIKPEYVTVIGPFKLLKSLKDSLFEIKIQERNIQADFDENENLKLDLPEHLEIETKEARVSFKVQQFITEKLDVELKFAHFPHGYSKVKAPEKVEIRVTIKPEDLEKFKNENFEVLLDYRNKKGKVIPIVFVNRPDYVGTYSLNPSEVTIQD